MRQLLVIFNYGEQLLRVNSLVKNEFDESGKCIDKLMDLIEYLKDIYNKQV